MLTLSRDAKPSVLRSEIFIIFILNMRFLGGVARPRFLSPIAGRFCTLRRLRLLLRTTGVISKSVHLVLHWHLKMKMVSLLTDLLGVTAKLQLHPLNYQLTLTTLSN